MPKLLFAIAACLLLSLPANAAYFVRVADLHRMPTPPNPVKVCGRVCAEIPLTIGDGSGSLVIEGLTARQGDFLTAEGDWDGHVLNTIRSAYLHQPAGAAPLVYVPAGSFMMGNSGAGNDLTYSDSRELPQHSVYLSSYWVGRQEVTRREFRRFVDAEGYLNSSLWSAEGWAWRVSKGLTQPVYWEAQQDWGTPPGLFTQTEDHPIAGVSYYEAEAYCNWVGFRLPTEAQWEKAARWDAALDHPRIYPWGDAWDAEFCNSRDDILYPGAQTSISGAYGSGVSGFGCDDMSGNVWEWCSDWYDGGYYVQMPTGGWSDPQGPSSGWSRVVRGGDWYGTDKTCRCAYRSFYAPGTNQGIYGFRLAR